MRRDVETIVRWGLPLLLVCVVSACGDASSGAPVDTVPVVTSAPTAATPQLADTTAPRPPTSTTAAVDLPTSTAPVTDPQAASVPPPTTAPAVELPIETLPLPREVSDASVLALAAVLGVDGEVESMERNAKCVGRLEPRGLCVNGPISGAWQYWDLDAQNSAGASDEEASAAALDVFTRIGVDPGVVTSVEPNGPLPQVSLSNGAVVTVAEGGRIAWMIASIDQMPAGEST